MNVIFKREDFSLCDVPVPNRYPQSQTHCGACFYNGKVYLTTSPYPNYKKSSAYIYFWAILKKLSLGLLGKKQLRRGEDYENPCIYENDDFEIKNLYPKKFKLLKNGVLMSKPLDKFGLGSYCSDPDLFLDNGKVYVINRTTIRKQRTGTPSLDYDTNVHLISFKIINHEVVEKQIVDLWQEHDVSPCLNKYFGEFVYFSLKTNSYNDGGACETLYIRRSKSVFSGWSDKEEVSICKGNYEPWHMSVFYYDGTLYSIIACVKRGEPYRCWTMLGQFSKDLRKLKIYQTPLTDFISYRSSAFVLPGGLFVLYNSVIDKSIQGGSVDGREIVVFSKAFKELLEILRGNERVI